MAKLKTTAICPRCFRVMGLTAHHVLPVRFFKRGPVIYLCRDCHDEIDAVFPMWRALSKKEYFSITKQWLQGKEVKVYG